MLFWAKGQEKWKKVSVIVAEGKGYKFVSGFSKFLQSSSDSWIAKSVWL